MSPKTERTLPRFSAKGQECITARFCFSESSRSPTLATMNRVFATSIFTLFASLANANPQTQPFEKLADDFWTWRAKYAPFTGDDVNRIERQGGMRDWSRAKIDNHRQELGEFETRWKKIDPPKAEPIPKQVDYKLIGSALARV